MYFVFSIDISGVISRVLLLFKGYFELIVGFNIFFLFGYKIEVYVSDFGIVLVIVLNG